MNKWKNKKTERYRFSIFIKSSADQEKRKDETSSWKRALKIPYFKGSVHEFYLKVSVHDMLYLKGVFMKYIFKWSVYKFYLKISVYEIYI